MIRIQQLKLPVGHTEEELLQRMAKHLRLSLEAFQKQAVRWEIAKRSIDARKKQDVHYVYAIDVELANEKQILRKVDSKNIMSTNPETYRLPPCGSRPLNDPPVVVGAGPAGLFCGLLLARAGYRPVLIERGQDVQSRKASVDRFWQTGELDPSSNVQFGEGGAGTFSDGKLNTLVKDVKGRSRFVLKTFVEFGAPEEILYDSKPHIGTDILLEVVERIREEIISLGGQVLFETCLTGFCWEQGRLAGLWCSQRGASVRIPARAAVLAIGHSARDTFELLQAEGFPMEAKAFAVGLRVEHPQQMISEGQYGEAAGKLPPAPYKVTASLADGRGVYSFCMCPGGYVVNASSEPGGLAVNGMSYSRRDSGNANSAIIVSVTPRDFGGEGALAGISSSCYAILRQGEAAPPTADLTAVPGGSGALRLCIPCFRKPFPSPFFWGCISLQGGSRALTARTASCPGWRAGPHPRCAFSEMKGWRAKGAGSIPAGRGPDTPEASCPPPWTA